MKNQQSIEISNTVRFPSFSNDRGDIHFYQYQVSALVYHIGSTPISGHYRTALQCGPKWFIYEDGRLPDQFSELTEQIQRNAVLIWLTPLHADTARTSRPTNTAEMVDQDGISAPMDDAPIPTDAD